MSRTSTILALLALSGFGLGQLNSSAPVLPATQAGPLNITALATRGNTSVIECWQLPGLPILLGSTVHWQLASQAGQPELTVLGPNTTIPQAWSSAVQLEILIAGEIKITAPYVAANDTSGVETQVAIVKPGSAGSAMLITTDIRGASRTGHVAEFTSSNNSVVVQIPFAGNVVPLHTVLHNGSCTAQEATGAGTGNTTTTIDSDGSGDDSTGGDSSDSGDDSN